MSARIPPGFAEVWLQFNIASDPENMYVALGVELAVGVSANVATVNSVMNAAYPALDNMISSAYTLGPGHMVFGQDGGDLRIDSTISPVIGVASANCLPQNCSVLARKFTGSGGRRGRGRMFIPGIPEGEVGGAGLLTSTYQTTAQTALDALFTGITGTAEVAALVLLHDTAPFTPTPITAIEVQTRIATQRRRLRP